MQMVCQMRSDYYEDVIYVIMNSGDMNDVVFQVVENDNREKKEPQMIYKLE
jgi:hypothetical protein